MFIIDGGSGGDKGHGKRKAAELFCNKKVDLDEKKRYNRIQEFLLRKESVTEKG